MTPAVTLDRVTKRYRRYVHRRQFATLKSALLNRSLVRDLSPAETLTAVDDVSLAVPAGAVIGIIGKNGSGKSTLLNLVAGITKPTSGRVAVRGRIAALIELGAGFHPEISGRENVFINGVMLGLTKREIADRFAEIVEFAELEAFIDAPVKTYSSGMHMRLGFAVAVNVDPDILLVDEVLAVGDEAFSLKCLDKFADFKRRGKTIVFVSHSLATVQRFCDEVVWLDEGRIAGRGDPPRIIQAYLTAVAGGEERFLSGEDQRRIEAVSPPDAASEPPDEGTPTIVQATSEDASPTDPEPEPSDGEDQDADPTADMFRASEGRWGSREAVITAVTIEGEGGPARVHRTGDRVRVRLQVTAEEALADFVFGIGIFNAEGVCCYGTNTDIAALEPDTMQGDGEVVFEIDHLDLVEGTYKLDVAIHAREGRPYDYHRLLHTFRVKSDTSDVGIYRPRHRWQFTPNIRFLPPDGG